MSESGLFGEELWDKFDEVVAHGVHGDKVSDTIATFLNKRAAIEKQYAASLASLVKATPSLKKEEGSIGAAFDSLVRHTSVLSESHKELERGMTQDFASLLLQLKDKQAKRRKELVSAHGKLGKDGSRRRSASRKSFQGRVSKRGKDHVASTQDETWEDVERKLAVEAADKVAPLLDELQELEQGRMHFIRVSFDKLINAEVARESNVADSRDSLVSAVKYIRPLRDLQDFAESLASGKPRPRPIGPYVFLTGTTDRVMKEVIQTLAGLSYERIGVGVRKMADGLGMLSTGGNIDLVEVGSGSIEELKTAFEDVQKLVILSPFMADNLDTEHLYVTAAKAARVKHIIKVSVHGAVLANYPNNPHAATEKVIKKSGIPWTILRPTMYMQDFVNFFSRDLVSRGELFGCIGDEAKVSYVDDRDVSACIVGAIVHDGHQGKTYELTGPDSITMTEVCSHLSKELEFPVKYTDMPPEAFKKYLLGLGLTSHQATSMVTYHQIACGEKKGADGSTLADVTNAVAKLTGSERETLHRQRPLHFDDFAEDYGDSLRLGDVKY